MTGTSDRESTPASLPLGTLLAGKYKLERVLGVGSSGVVYAAHHPVLDERVAVKVLRPDLAADAAVVSRFQREARAVARIPNEHVARVIDVARAEDDRLFVVMELLDGEDLARLLALRGALPIRDAIDYLLEACEALAHAHTHGIVHRNLKPTNLFLVRSPDRAPHIKILDFGISKIIESALGEGHLVTSAGKVLGPLAYVSPEQLLGSKSVEMRSDLWSLGVIAYELLTRALPMVGEGNTLAPISQRRPDLPASLQAAIHRCLQRAPEARFRNVCELAEALAPHGSAIAMRALTSIEALLGLSSELSDTLRSEPALPVVERVPPPVRIAESTPPPAPPTPPTPSPRPTKRSPTPAPLEPKRTTDPWESPRAPEARSDRAPRAHPVVLITLLGAFVLLAIAASVILMRASQPRAPAAAAQRASPVQDESDAASRSDVTR